MSNDEETKDKKIKLCIQYIYGPAWVGMKGLITILQVSKTTDKKGSVFNEETVKKRSYGDNPDCVECQHPTSCQNISLTFDCVDRPPHRKDWTLRGTPVGRWSVGERGEGQ